MLVWFIGTEIRLTIMPSSLRHLLLAGLMVSLPTSVALAAEPLVVIESDMSEDEQDLLRSVLGEVEADVGTGLFGTGPARR